MTALSERKRMAKVHTVLLSSGGMRSLVAAGSLPRGGIAWLFIRDGRDSEALHRHAFIRQAEHFEAGKRIELAMDHVRAQRAASGAPLVQLQIMTVAASEAVRLGADSLIWPVSAGDDFDKISRITETLVLLEHAVKLESGVELRIDTPLIDLTMKQVVEAGEQMSLPWRMTRTCVGTAPKPCGVCSACEARRRAFATAHVDDPLVTPARNDPPAAASTDETTGRPNRSTE